MLRKLTILPSNILENRNQEWSCGIQPNQKKYVFFFRYTEFTRNNSKTWHYTGLKIIFYQNSNFGEIYEWKSFTVLLYESFCTFHIIVFQMKIYICTQNSDKYRYFFLTWWKFFQVFIHLKEISALMRAWCFLKEGYQR